MIAEYVQGSRKARILKKETVSDAIEYYVVDCFDGNIVLSRDSFVSEEYAIHFAQDWISNG